MNAKTRLLSFVGQHGAVGSEDVAAALGYTLPGAASMLLRLHRHGHLQRRRFGQAFLYTLAPKGKAYLLFVQSRPEKAACRSSWKT